MLFKIRVLKHTPQKHCMCLYVAAFSSPIPPGVQLNIKPLQSSFQGTILRLKILCIETTLRFIRFCVYIYNIKGVKCSACLLQPATRSCIRIKVGRVRNNCL